jgi:two-component system chemotaxis sensor kinase CheA
LTQFLDIHRLAERLFGMTPSRSRPTPDDRHSRRLLLIDDTAFFREVIKRYLEPEGYEIFTAIHGQDGLTQLDSKGPFDLIVSDIEMPVMDGWQFAREVRRRGIATPMLALTSLSGSGYETKAKECGYDSYEVKLDHDRLVRKIGSMLAETALTT